MSRLRSSFINMVLSLGGFTILAGVLLGLVHSLTAGPIEDARVKAVNDAIAEVVPTYDNEPAKMAVEVGEDGREMKIYPAFLGDDLVGAAVESWTDKGFSGNISVMFGFDTEGRVIGYKVLSHSETPGLGAKMEEWFRMEDGRRSVLGLNPGEKRLRVAKDGGDVDGITAATISSRAFLDALQRGYSAFIDYRDGLKVEQK